jgi:hypothetical protein
MWIAAKWSVPHAESMERKTDPNPLSALTFAGVLLPATRRQVRVDK